MPIFPHASAVRLAQAIADFESSKTLARRRRTRMGILKPAMGAPLRHSLRRNSRNRKFATGILNAVFRRRADATHVRLGSFGDIGLP